MLTSVETASDIALVENLHLPRAWRKKHKQVLPALWAYAVHGVPEKNCGNVRPA